MKKIFFLGLMTLCFLSSKAQYGTYSVQNRSNLRNEGISQLLLEGLRNGTTIVTVEYEDDEPNARSMKPQEIDTTTMVDVITQIFEEEGVTNDLVKNVPARVTVTDTSIVVENKDFQPINAYRILKVRQNRKKNGWDFYSQNDVKITMEQMNPETQKVYQLHLPDGTNLNIRYDK